MSISVLGARRFISPILTGGEEPWRSCRSSKCCRLAVLLAEPTHAASATTSGRRCVAWLLLDVRSKGVLSLSLKEKDGARLSFFSGALNSLMNYGMMFDPFLTWMWPCGCVGTVAN